MSMIQQQCNEADTLRLQLVDIRADLRYIRQQLARRKREVQLTLKLTGRTAREREQEQDHKVHEDSAVMQYENMVLGLQKREDLTEARLENALRPFREYSWLVRERMADAQNELATSIATCPLHTATCPLHRLAVVITASTADEDGAFTSESEYIRERSIS